MPCCSFDRRSDAFHPLAVFVVCGGLLLVLVPLAGLFRVLARLGRWRGGSTRLDALVRATAKVVASDLLHPRVRCAVSSRLLDRSPRLAGLAYRHFNLAALGLGWCVVVGAVLTAANLLS